MYRSRAIPGRAQLEQAQAEAALWRNLYVLSPWARPQHLPPLRHQDRRRLWPRPRWHRAVEPSQIPTQRSAPAGVPPRSRIQLPRRTR